MGLVVGVLGLVTLGSVYSLEMGDPLPGFDPIVRFIIHQLDRPSGDDAQTIPFAVQPGENATTIGKNLKKEGLIRSDGLFGLLVRYYGVDGHLESGYYQLSRDMTATQIIRRLGEGLVKPTTVTIVEGLRAEEIAEALRPFFDPQDFLKAFSEAPSSYDFLKDKPGGSSLEGYLFPDTYRLPFPAKATSFLGLMLQNFGARVTPDLRQKAEARGLSLHEVVTLASIVEREAVLPQERRLIAGVFLNRWRQGLPLAADPTVQYALAMDSASRAQYGYWKVELTEEDLAVDSPYNTYMHDGLPPGPIANPGLAAIEAVLEPETTDYLYFVAKKDGSHAFARTWEEHQANVSMYRP
ncbi:MAG: endolytic transglycosylase MltG [Chloroflexi bacterium]|nr:endolytic transglycosylase MltG [Chloroflexota bacterium]